MAQSKRRIKALEKSYGSFGTRRMIAKKAGDFKIFLASQSPRRREILSENFDKVCLLPGIGAEPRWGPGQKPREHVLEVIDAKWMGALQTILAEKLKGPAYLVVADTIVLCAGQVLGKPRSLTAARDMLKLLSGRKHEVLSAYRVAKVGKSGALGPAKTQIVSTQVEFHRLQPAEISSYVRTFRPLDKAGAYGFQDGALKFVNKIKGSYLSVMGFPLNNFMECLDELR